MPLKQRGQITSLPSSVSYTGHPFKCVLTTKSCLVYSCMNGTAPQYLREPILFYLPVHHLRSSTQSRLRIPSIDKGNKNKQNKNALESEHFPKLQQDLADRRMANPMDPVLSHHTSQERQPAFHDNLQQDLADRRMANPMDPVLNHHTSQERQPAVS